MRAVAQLLNEMRSGGVIQNYALFGATAQMRYTEPVATLDADVLVAVPAVPSRVARAVHLAVIALSVGRAKDFTRILALLESGAVTRPEIGLLAARHGLSGAWQQFETKFFHE